MAKNNLAACCTASGLEYEYLEHAWGDVISGSKEVLQLMGIGERICFPGEPGGNKRQVTTTDPRGFPCTIERQHAWSKFPYCVRISHPGRNYQYPGNEWREAFPGVQRSANGPIDCFKGSAEALEAAGIVPSGMFPGMPGMRSMRVTILPDGTLSAGHRNAYRGRPSEGEKTIEKLGKSNYRVVVRVASELADKRYAAYDADRQAWEARMAEAPRAPRLDRAIRCESNELTRRKPAALRLVWSRPQFVPGFNTLPQGPYAR